MYIIAKLQDISAQDRPAANHGLKWDTSLPFNLDTRSKLQRFVNSRETLDNLPEFSKIDWGKFEQLHKYKYLVILCIPTRVTIRMGYDGSERYGS